jgi:inhibitor of KinA sporulation pathway (predicted exonuclease)
MLALRDFVTVEAGIARGSREELTAARARPSGVSSGLRSWYRPTVTTMRTTHPPAIDADIPTPRHYLVVDLEATTSAAGSLPPEEMETIEIGAVIVDGATLAPLGEFQSFVRPVRHPKLLPFCTQLTSITQSMVDDAPSFPEAFEALQTAVRGLHPLVFGSWGRYDHEQLRRDCALHGIRYQLGAAHLNLKTAFSAKQGLKRQLGMTRALARCGLDLHGAHHRGIDDARNIARMLPWIVGDRRLDAK